MVTGESGLLSRPDAAPGVIVDSSTVSPDASAEVRAVTDERGVALLAAPVSGNPSVVDAGKLTVVVSGPERRLGGRAPLPRAVRGRRHVRRRRRCRPARQDLPQPDARRGGAVARRDHGARGEGWRFARGVPRVPQQERDGVDVHGLQDAGDREPRLHADLHPGAALQGLPSRLRGGRGARRADAGGRGRPAGGPGADGLRLRGRRLHGSARAGGARRPGSSSCRRTCR